MKATLAAVISATAGSRRFTLMTSRVMSKENAKDPR
jgi:hypothetical protein